MTHDDFDLLAPEASDFEDALDFEDGYDLEDGYDDEDPFDIWDGVGMAASFLGNQGGNLYKKYKKRTPKWMRSRGGSALIQGLLGGLAKGGSALIKPVDEAEPEYEAEDIAEMEGLAERVVEASDDPAQAADGMARLAFGPTRADPRMRVAMAALRREAARAMAQARRSPRARTTARLVPHAMRRTVVLLMRLNARGRRPSPALAVQAFRQILSRMARSGQLRRIALRRSQAYAARARRGGHGGYGRRAAARPVWA